MGLIEMAACDNDVGIDDNDTDDTDYDDDDDDDDENGDDDDDDDDDEDDNDNDNGVLLRSSLPSAKPLWIMSWDEHLGIGDRYNFGGFYP